MRLLPVRHDPVPRGFAKLLNVSGALITDSPDTSAQSTPAAPPLSMLRTPDGYETSTHRLGSTRARRRWALVLRSAARHRARRPFALGALVSPQTPATHRDMTMRTREVNHGGTTHDPAWPRQRALPPEGTRQRLRRAHAPGQGTPACWNGGRGYYLTKIAVTGGLFAAGWAVFVLWATRGGSSPSPRSWPCVFTQIGFIGHDAGHRQIFRSQAGQLPRRPGARQPGHRAELRLVGRQAQPPPRPPQPARTRTPTSTSARWPSPPGRPAPNGAA